MEHYGVDINRKRARVVIDSSLPHLMALEEDVLSTGVVLYHLKVRRLVHLLPPQPLAQKGAHSHVFRDPDQGLRAASGI